MKLTSNSKLLYQQLRDDLQNFPHGSRFYSVRQIMKRYRYSQRVVEDALDKMTRENLIRREPCVGIFSQSAPDRTRRRIQFLLPDWPSNYLQAWSRNLNAEAGRHDWQLQTHYYNPERQDFMTFPMGAQNALIFMCSAQTLDWRTLNWLQRTSEHIPVVVLGGYIGDLPLSCVSPMDEFSGWQALSHLYEYGHRRILMVISEPHNHSVRKRLQGARNFVATHPGMNLELLDCFTHSGELAMQHGYDGMSARIESGPADFTAVYADSHDSAPGALKALYEHGFRVPDEVSIVCNDILPEGAFFTPPLTAVGARGEMMARAVIDGLEDIFSGLKHSFQIEVTPVIEKRNSVAAAPEVSMKNKETQKKGKAS